MKVNTEALRCSALKVLCHSLFSLFSFNFFVCLFLRDHHYHYLLPFPHSSSFLLSFLLGFLCFSFSLPLRRSSLWIPFLIGERALQVGRRRKKNGQRKMKEQEPENEKEKERSEAFVVNLDFLFVLLLSLNGNLRSCFLFFFFLFSSFLFSSFGCCFAVCRWSRKEEEEEGEEERRQDFRMNLDFPYALLPSLNPNFAVFLPFLLLLPPLFLLWMLICGLSGGPGQPGNSPTRSKRKREREREMRIFDMNLDLRFVLLPPLDVHLWFFRWSWQVGLALVSRFRQARRPHPRAVCHRKGRNGWFILHCSGNGQ